MLSPDVEIRSSPHQSKVYRKKLSETEGSTVGRLKRLERLGRGRERTCLVCSAASEAFGAARTLSDPTECVKSEEEGGRTSEPLDSLIVGGAEYCVRFGFLRTPLRHFLFSCFGVLT